MAAAGPSEPEPAAHRQRATAPGDGLRPQQAGRRGGRHGGHAALGDRASPDGLRPTRPRGAQGVPDGSAGCGAGVRRRQPAALRRARRATWPRRWSRPERRPPPRARSITPAIPRSSTSAELVRAVGTRHGPARRASVPVPSAVGRALLAVTELAARLARSDDHPHQRQGERVLSGRPGPAIPALSPETRAGGPRTISRPAWPTPTDGTGPRDGSRGDASTRAASRSRPARLRPLDLILLGLSWCRRRGPVGRRTSPGAGGSWPRTRCSASLLYLVTRPGLGPVGRTIREIYPLLLLVGLYSELDVLDRAGTLHDLRRDWSSAGSWPSSGASSARSGGARAEPLLVARAPRAPTCPTTSSSSPRPSTSSGDATCRPLRHFVLVVMTTFVVCYLVFIFFPVAGPYYVFPRPAAWFTDNVFARMVYDTLATGSSYGAAFPSSHVAATVAARSAARRARSALGLGARAAHGPAHGRRWSIARCTTAWTRWPGCWWAASWPPPWSAGTDTPARRDAQRETRT